MLENGCSINFKYDSVTEDVVMDFKMMVNGKIYTQKAMIPLSCIDSPRDIGTCIDLVMDRFIMPQIEENHNGKTV